MIAAIEITAMHRISRVQKHIKKITVTNEFFVNFP